MSESKTPLTDKVWRLSGDDKPWSIVLYDDRYRVSAKLETQLAARERELAEITAERDRLREVFQVPATVTDPLFIMDGWRDQHSGALRRLGELERELAELRQRDTCGREELSDLRAKLAASETERERLSETLLKTQRLARDLREERDAARSEIRKAVESTIEEAVKWLRDIRSCLPESGEKTCKGTNCGCTDGWNHSPECHAEHNALCEDAAMMDHVDHGGWKCAYCGYNGQDNQRGNVFCARCAVHK